MAYVDDGNTYKIGEVISESDIFTDKSCIFEIFTKSNFIISSLLIYDSKF